MEIVYKKLDEPQLNPGCFYINIVTMTGFTDAFKNAIIRVTREYNNKYWSPELKQRWQMRREIINKQLKIVEKMKLNLDEEDKERDRVFKSVPFDTTGFVFPANVDYEIWDLKIAIHLDFQNDINIFKEQLVYLKPFIIKIQNIIQKYNVECSFKIKISDETHENLIREAINS